MPGFSFFELIWLVLLLASVVPMLQRIGVQRRRFALLRAVERSRRSRIITLIHRQESASFLGLLMRRYINIEDSEAVLRAIRLTDDETPIDLILHTPGGLVLASEQIARALLRHPAKVTVFVPHYAMSGGTMIALAADEIRMDENAVLGPVDPQLGQFPAASILQAVQRKPVERVDDETLILADIAGKAMEQVKEVVFEILSQRMDEDKARTLAALLAQGAWTHDYPLTCERLQSWGLPIQCGLPPSIYALMALYPQPASRRPSVQYVPVPNRRGERDERARPE